jgi:hypothetical protein
VEIGLEKYLYGLGEMPSSWHMEALKAQAIAGRTYALRRAWIYRNLAANEARMDACSCHLYASTLDQNYIGWAKEAEGSNGFWGDRWVSAVDATAGKALIHTASNNRAIQSNYFSSSGGRTENNEDVWGGTAIPYLRSVADPGPSSWTHELTTGEFAAGLRWDAVIGASINGRFDSGSPSGITVRGYDGGVKITQVFSGNQLRSALGLRSHFIKSFVGFLPTSFSVFREGDFDGDSVDELAAFSTVDGTWWVFDHDGGELVGYKWADFQTSNGWGPQIVGDFNGDGRDDIANFYPGNGTWWIARSTGSSFSTTMWADFSTATGWKAQIAGDFDGDGRDDIANFHPSNGTWWVSKSTGSSLSTGLWADFSTAKGWGPQIAGDYNGDGKDDIANFHPSNGTWWVSKSTGSSFGTEMWADFTTATGWSPQIAGDFDGDGKDDIANFHDSNGSWWVSKSTGSSFGTGLWADFTTTKGWSPQLVGDVNGDGKDDIANFYPANGSWWVSRSTGAAFSTYRHGVLSGFGWQGHQVADIDGDGKDELAAWAPTPLVWSVR